MITSCNCTLLIVANPDVLVVENNLGRRERLLLLLYTSLPANPTCLDPPLPHYILQMHFANCTMPLNADEGAWLVVQNASVGQGVRLCLYTGFLLIMLPCYYTFLPEKLANPIPF